MTTFTQDLGHGAKLGLKIALTGWITVALVCLAFTGFGILLIGPVSEDAFRMIWGK